MFRLVFYVLLILLTISGCDVKRIEFEEIKIVGQIHYYNNQPFNGIVWKPFNKDKQRIEYEFEVRNGLINGQFIKYSNNGQIREISNYVEGLKNGNSILYFYNGRVLTETPYFNGLKHGVKKRFDINGNLIEELKYVKGELQNGSE